MTCAAQLRALAPEDLTRFGGIDGEFEGIRLPGYHVALEQEPRHVEGVDDVGAVQRDLHGSADRHGHAADARVHVVGGRQLGGHLPAVPIQVLELPLELAGDRVDPDVGLRAHRIDVVERLPRDHEHVQDDDRRDDGPDDFDKVVAVRLDRQLRVRRTPAIPEHAPDDQPFDEQEDGDRDREHDVVEPADLASLLGHRVRRVEGVAEAGEEDGDDERNQDAHDEAGDEYVRRRSLPGASRHRRSSDR